MVRNLACSFQIRICLWMISLCLALLAALSIWNWIDYLRASDWGSASATINKIEFASSSETEGSEALSKPIGGKLECEYRYVFKGDSFSGNRLGVETFGTSAMNERRYEEMRKLQNAGGQLTILVIPKNPKESAIFREATCGMALFPAAAVT